MKLTLLQLMVLMAGGTSALSQGNIIFANQLTGSLREPVYGVNAAAPTTPHSWPPVCDPGPCMPPPVPPPLLSGTGYTASLWARPEGSSDDYGFVASSFFRTGQAAGYWVTSTVNVPGIPPGQRAQFLVRAWDNQGGQITAWAQVLADPSIPHGESWPFGAGPLGGIDQGVVFTTPSTLGFRSFNLFVPEPSTIGLGALAVGALVLLSVRKPNQG